MGQDYPPGVVQFDLKCARRSAARREAEEALETVRSMAQGALTNEKLTRGRVEALEGAVGELQGWRSGGFLARVRWLLLGR